MEKVVLDTNTLISALLWDGNEAKIVEKAEKKKIHLFISQEILEELEGVLKREKFIKRLESREYTVEKAVAKIALISTLIEPNIVIDVIKEDPEDNKVLECAVPAKAKYIISCDNHLLCLGTYSG
ncbi:putative toxin-antitoxin system toxin component, PIN family [Candidatus Kuenenia sp.]|uniref:putative toxin-antitoxin system toxin component, PIN family n=1 Tax=Candidatus Kuenenia sp. TaxID=2499824 RepID=UPI00322082EA